MKKLLLLLLLVSSMSAQAGIAFLKHSYVSGVNRVCVYDYLGSEVVFTKASYELCPLQIEL